MSWVGSGLHTGPARRIITACYDLSDLSVDDLSDLSVDGLDDLSVDDPSVRRGVLCLLCLVQGSGHSRSRCTYTVGTIDLNKHSWGVEREKLTAQTDEDSNQRQLPDWVMIFYNMVTELQWLNTRSLTARVKHDLTPMM